jgi:hypothetical protein
VDVSGVLKSGSNQHSLKPPLSPPIGNNPT